jgi:hypothetical protein
LTASRAGELPDADQHVPVAPDFAVDDVQPGPGAHRHLDPVSPHRRHRPDVAQVAEAVRAEPCCWVPALWQPVS